MTFHGKFQGFSDLDLKALRLMKRRHRPVAVEKALSLRCSRATKLRRQAIDQGWTFPAMPKTATPCSVREYLAACHAAAVVPQPNIMRELAPPLPAAPWPHLVDYPLPPTPRSVEAGEQAARVFKAVEHMRYVPAGFAGGGERHFARECAKHLAMLMAYAPGRRYPDDPKALRPEPRVKFSPPATSRGIGSASAQLLEVA